MKVESESQQAGPHAQLDATWTLHQSSIIDRDSLVAEADGGSRRFLFPFQAASCVLTWQSHQQWRDGRIPKPRIVRPRSLRMGMQRSGRNRPREEPKKDQTDSHSRLVAGKTYAGNLDCRLDTPPKEAAGTLSAGPVDGRMKRAVWWLRECSDGNGNGDAGLHASCGGG
ncbi:hypothetical protein HDK77DRAFT_300783 [Phyllosticta capitalensis]